MPRFRIQAVVQLEPEWFREADDAEDPDATVRAVADAALHTFADGVENVWVEEVAGWPNAPQPDGG
jgi:hypothetical protein